MEDELRWPGMEVGVIDGRPKEQWTLCPSETMNRFKGRGVGDSKIYSRRHVFCTEEQTWKESEKTEPYDRGGQERTPSTKSEEGGNSGTYE